MHKNNDKRLPLIGLLILTVLMEAALMAQTILARRNRFFL